MTNGAFKVTEKLLQWSELKGWTQRQLAEALNYDEAAVSRWFDKESPEHPSWQMMKKLCLLTGLNIGDLLTFDRVAEQKD